MRVLLCTDGLAGARAATTWLERFVPSEPWSLCIAAIAQMPPLGLRSSSARSAIQELMLERSRHFCEAARNDGPRFRDSEALAQGPVSTTS